MKPSTPPEVTVRSVSAAVVPAPPTFRPLAAVSLSFSDTAPNLPALAPSKVTPLNSLLALASVTLIVAVLAVSVVAPATDSVPAACVMAPPASTFRSRVSVSAGNCSEVLVSCRSRSRSEAGNVGTLAAALTFLRPTSRTLPPPTVETVTAPAMLLSRVARRMSRLVLVSILSDAPPVTDQTPDCAMLPPLVTLRSRDRLRGPSVVAPFDVVVRSRAVIVPAECVMTPLGALKKTSSAPLPSLRMLPPTLMSLTELNVSVRFTEKFTVPATTSLFAVTLMEPALAPEPVDLTITLPPLSALPMVAQERLAALLLLLSNGCVGLLLPPARLALAALLMLTVSGSSSREPARPAGASALNCPRKSR